MQGPHKVCPNPNCGLCADIDAAQCSACGHQFRTKFNQPQFDQTTAFQPIPPASQSGSTPPLGPMLRPGTVTAAQKPPMDKFTKTAILFIGSVTMALFWMGVGANCNGQSQTSGRSPFTILELSRKISVGMTMRRVAEIIEVGGPASIDHPDQSVTFRFYASDGLFQVLADRNFYVIDYDYCPTPRPSVWNSQQQVAR